MEASRLSPPSTPTSATFTVLQLAFYRDENSLRDCYCIGRQCKLVVWDDKEGEGDNGKGLCVLENRREAGEDLNKNSSAEECPLLPADVLPPSPCLSLGWGLFFPPLSSKNLSFLPFSPSRTLRFGDLGGNRQWWECR
jgi:hypothetical protein